MSKRRRRAGLGVKVTGLYLEIGDDLEIPVTLNSRGEFYAEWEGDTYKSTTFAGLRTKLLPVVTTSTKRCAIQVLRKDYSDEFYEVTLIGLHAGNGNLLYVDAEGATHQERGEQFYRVMTPEERQEIERMGSQITALQDQLNEYIRERKIHARNMVRQAVGLPLQPTDTDDEE